MYVEIGGRDNLTNNSFRGDGGKGSQTGVSQGTNGKRGNTDGTFRKLF